jgi:hypothetical protein
LSRKVRRLGGRTYRERKSDNRFALASAEIPGKTFAYSVGIDSNFFKPLNERAHQVSSAHARVPSISFTTDRPAPFYGALPDEMTSMRRNLT